MTCQKIVSSSLCFVLIACALVSTTTQAKTFSEVKQTLESDVDLNKLAQSTHRLMRQYHYNPAELNNPSYKAMEESINKLAENSIDVKSFIDGFNKAWQQGPFSHVMMQQSQQSADNLAAYLDKMTVGDKGSSLTWDEDVAIMTINTMMGTDTIERISAFYQQITSKNAKALVIDLRNNNGGAFAVKPLVGHLLTQPIDAGVFVSQPWNAKHEAAPTRDYLQTVTPWQGWSIQSFWKDVQNNEVTRIQMTPMQPTYKGEVYVLTSKTTASAAELGTDALGNLSNVTIIGEVTEGAMLSQTIFDVAPGVHLLLPIADYYSLQNGRIEGNGVTPDIEVSADKAMEKARALITAK